MKESVDRSTLITCLFNLNLVPVFLSTDILVISNPNLHHNLFPCVEDTFLFIFDVLNKEKKSAIFQGMVLYDQTKNNKKIRSQALHEKRKKFPLYVFIFLCW